MCSYNKIQISPHDPTKIAIHSIFRPEDDLISNCGQQFKKTVSFDDIVHFIEEEDIVTYEDFDCGITFYTATPTKIRQNNRERNYISSSRENSKCIPSNDRHNCFIDEQHNFNIFLNTIYGKWFQQILCHSVTLMIDTLCPISTLNQQLPNLEQSHIRRSLHCERRTVKGMDCASHLHSFNEITYQTGEWTKQLLRLKSWVMSRNPERWMEFRRLWWIVIVFKCSHLFHLFDFYCLLVQYLLFFRKFTFFVPFDDLSEK